MRTAARGRRTHRMMRAAGLADNGQLSLKTSASAACKLWFPCTETVGTTITDVIQGAVLTPSTIAFNIAHAIQIEASTASGPIGTGIALTAGSFPNIGTKDFILFAVQYAADAVARANSYLGLTNPAGDYIGVFDGDGAQWFKASGGLGGGGESVAGITPPGYASNAVVRNGSALAVWCKNSNPQAGAPASAATGDMYSRVLRNDNFSGSDPTTYGNYARNDYGIPDSVIRTWQDPLGGMTSITHWGNFDFGNAPGGLDGMWSKIGALDMGTPTKIQIGNHLVATNNYYGIALFVFDNGLPSDFKEKLRWMHDQWINGNKVMPADWLSVQ